MNETEEPVSCFYPFETDNNIGTDNYEETEETKNHPSASHGMMDGFTIRGIFAFSHLITTLNFVRARSR